MALGDHQNGSKLLKKRKRSAMDVLRLALYTLGWKSSRSSPKSSKSMEVDHVVCNFSWKGLLGSMRPMHLQNDQSPRPPIQPESIPIFGEQKEEAIIITPPLSPMARRVVVSAHSPNFSISSYGSDSDLSQYESPLNEIHVVEPSEEEIWYDNDDAGDEMIDVKAEEFIAHFYQQMRLQNSD